MGDPHVALDAALADVRLNIAFKDANQRMLRKQFAIWFGGKPV